MQQLLRGSIRTTQGVHRQRFVREQQEIMGTPEYQKSLGRSIAIRAVAEKTITDTTVAEEIIRVRKLQEARVEARKKKEEEEDATYIETLQNEHERRATLALDLNAQTQEDEFVHQGRLLGENLQPVYQDQDGSPAYSIDRVQPLEGDEEAFAETVESSDESEDDDDDEEEEGTASGARAVAVSETATRSAEGFTAGVESRPVLSPNAEHQGLEPWVEP